MQDNSDQFATPEEEAAFHEEIIGTDDPVEETDNLDEISEEAGESEESEPVKPKKTGYVDIQDPVIKARVDQITREKHELDRKLKAANARLEQLEKPPEPPKEVPVPQADPVTQPELFTHQQIEREKYIREHTKYEADTEARNHAKQQAEAHKQSALLETYQKNILRLNVNPQTLHKASEKCTEYGISKDLVEHLLEDPDGPAIVIYLSNNDSSLSDIVNMKPAKAAAFIEREVRGNLNIKKQSKAPPPPTKVSGTRQSGSNSARGWTIS